MLMIWIHTTAWPFSSCHNTIYSNSMCIIEWAGYNSPDHIATKKIGDVTASFYPQLTVFFSQDHPRMLCTVDSALSNINILPVQWTAFTPSPFSPLTSATESSIAALSLTSQTDVVRPLSGSAPTMPCRDGPTYDAHTPPRCNPYHASMKTGGASFKNKIKSACTSMFCSRNWAAPFTGDKSDCV